MTKFKSYEYGPHTFKSYMKPVGHGYEVGFTCKGQSYFVGNFIHKAEATKWWGMFNKEIKAFSNKYRATNKMPFTWYCNFLSTHLYKCYYAWLDKTFMKYETSFKKSFNKDAKRYMKLKKTASPTATPYRIAG